MKDERMVAYLYHQKSIKYRSMDEMTVYMYGESLPNF